jgi:hypothetical protein
MLLALIDFALMLSYDVTLALVCGALVTIGGMLLAGSGIRLNHWQRQLVELDNSLPSKVFETLLGLQSWPLARTALSEVAPVERKHLGEEAMDPRPALPRPFQQVNLGFNARMLSGGREDSHPMPAA